jgi:hypothetical protein
MIGKDFPPNNFFLFGLDLTDPTDFIYDVILGILALYYCYKISKFSQPNEFFSNWKNFYLYFGLATLLSAFGHLFYNYFHYLGKVPGWIVIPISTYWIGRAILSAHQNKNVIKKANFLFLMKLITTYVICLVVWLNINPLEKPQLLFLPIAIDTIVGLLVAVGFYSFKFSKEISSNFRYILLGIIIIFPSAFIFILKINLHQWFSKNDFSHVLMVFAISFFFYGVNKLQKEQSFLFRNKK